MISESMPLPPMTPVTMPGVMGACLAEIVDAHGPARSVAFYVAVNGEPVLRDGWDLVPQPSDLIEAVVLPRGGDDSKSVLGIVALIALSAFAPWAGGLVAGALGAGSGGLIAGLAGTAILAGGGILINTLLAPKPAASVSNELSVSPTYSASPSGNQARLYQPIPVQYGQHIMVPDYVSDPYQEFEGNDQYLFLLFGRGLGRSAVKDVRIGETVVWTEADGYSGVVDDLEIEFYEPGEQVTLFPVQVETSSEVGGQLLDHNVTIGPFAAVPSGEAAQKLGVDILLPEGLYRIENDGAKQSASVQVRFQYREIDDLGAAIGSWQTFADETLSLTTPTPQRFSYSVDVPAGRYEVQAVRLNAWSDGDQTFDRLEWNGLRAYLDGPQSFADLSTMAVKVKVNEQLTSQSSQDFRLVQCRILPVWNGSSWVEQETRSITWAAIDAARNTVYGAGEADAKIDFTTLMAYDTLWDARGDTFDGIFDTRLTRFDAINTILSAGRASIRFAGDQISMVRDEQRSLPAQVFTDRNIIRGSLEVTYDLHQTDSADDVIVEYMDSSSWKQEEVRCTIAQSSSEAPARVRMLGLANRDQAWREGIHLAADNYFRREKASFRTELEGRLVMRGDLIRIQSDMPQTWGKSGVVLAHSGLTVTLDREPETDPANTYIRFRQKNGEEWGPCKVTWTPGSTLVTLDTADHDAAVVVFGGLSPHLIDNGGEAPVYLLGEGVNFTFDAIVIGMVPEGKRVRLEVVRDNAAVHLADGGLTVPDYPAGTLLPPSTGSPSITKISAARELSVTESFLSVSGSASAGATSYAVEISYDNTTWTPVYEGRVPAASFAVRRDALWLRMQAIGDRPGPWNKIPIAAAPGVVRLPDGAVVPSAQSLYDEVAGEVPAAELISDLQSATNMAREVRDSLFAGADALSGGNSIMSLLGMAGESQLQTMLIAETDRARLQSVSANILRVETIVEEKGVAFAEQITVVTAVANQNAAQIIQVDQARADGETALALSITALTAEVDDNAAAILTEQSARADGDGVLASSLTSVSTTVGGHTSSISTLQTSVNGLEAQYVLSVSAGGAVGGFTITGIEQGDGSGSIDFGIAADRFYIVDPSNTNTAVAPLVFQGGTLYLNDLVVVSITASTLSSITANLGTITAGKIQSTDGNFVIDCDNKRIEIA
ncbi:hypothetical protein LP7551_02059 [Roseibium album]|nr:hypothetical protein LP7551_02059 [Roseibium album]